MQTPGNEESNPAPGGPRRRSGGGASRGFLGVLILLILITPPAWIAFGPGREPPPYDPINDRSPAPPIVEATHDEVVRACGACHAYPSPELFPKALWPAEVDRGFGFLNKAQSVANPPTRASVLAYYQGRAPEALPRLKPTDTRSPLPVRFEGLGYRPEGVSERPAISNVKIARLSDERRLDVVACDMVNGLVLLLKPYEPDAKLRVISEAISNPAHVEVVDLNRDGIRDLLVADLGSPVPTESRLGRVFWLRGGADGSFSPFLLADELGRVSDVRAADFDGDGDLDLIVAVFGRLTIGEILLLENRTTDDNRPVFVRSVVDPRDGAIHVPIVDLDGDGRPDFVALIAQEHESVVAFLGAGDRTFRREVIYQAPHPAFGSSGMDLVDLDRDGDLDVLMTNGDALDSELLRPYHGVQWLENRGKYPFEPHHLTSLHGVARAVAADLDRDGDLDIVATCFLPGPGYGALARERSLDAIVVLEQVAPGRFDRHSLETATCDHATCDVGDLDGDGNIDLVTGNFFMPESNGSRSDQPATDWLIIRKNLGARR